MDECMDKTRQAELFKVLSVGSRIRIIELLKQKGPLGVNELSEALGITPSAVSQHLKILRFAGLVRCERKGYCLPYEIDKKAMNHCREVLAEVCTCGCSGSGRVNGTEWEEIEDNVALLKDYERKLKMELRELSEKIRELEQEE
jgi:ArsR family transcriptional regulator